MQENQNAKYKVTVLIPTKNGGILFKRVIEALLLQETSWDFEILIIDSGSKDGTLEFCQTLESKIRFHTISPEEFGHGKTRNLGISMCESAFIALLTQDALPADSRWLQNIVATVEQAPDIAGAFGRHFAYPGGNPFVERDLKEHFNMLFNYPHILKLDTEESYNTYLSCPQIWHFFSDNNACIRRSVWEKIPYPDVEFAEDQIWAKKILEAGYAKAYADDAAVFHSHNYSVLELGRRSFDEAKALFSLFGYRLCPSILHLLFYFSRSSMKDISFSVNSKLIFNQPIWVLKSPLLNLSRQIGYYLAGQAHHLPDFVTDLISLNQSIKKGNLKSKMLKQKYN
ncbi:MAG: glycosyltransferase family 2 protein [Scytonematopsis contorta HA4267-MV1]|jgi:rhamnosyltransferase|nr:glycosyltransferase family 2 protein [Scytonematopsis contorta HA4267-MV1]